MWNRRTTTTLAAAAFGLAMCSAELVPAFGQGRATAAVELAGVTTVSAAAYSASMEVNVPRAVRFPDDGYLNLPYVRISGTASAAAIYLIPAGTASRTVEVNMFGALPNSLGHHSIGTFPNGTERLAAGLYTLVLVHSPGTAKITIHFPGLSGRTTLRPRSRSSAKLVLLQPPSVAPGRFPPVGTSGIVDRAMDTRGLISVHLGVELPVGGVTHGETCMYPGGGDLPSALNLAPGCSDGNSGAFLTPQGELSYGGSQFLNWGPGNYGAAIDYQASNSPTGVAGWAAWVPYNG